jgi:hypothetical protein
MATLRQKSGNEITHFGSGWAAVHPGHWQHNAILSSVHYTKLLALETGRQNLLLYFSFQVVAAIIGM